MSLAKKHNLIVLRWISNSMYYPKWTIGTLRLSQHRQSWTDHGAGNIDKISEVSTCGSWDMRAHGQIAYT